MKESEVMGRLSVSAIAILLFLRFLLDLAGWAYASRHAATAGVLVAMLMLAAVMLGVAVGIEKGYNGYSAGRGHGRMFLLSWLRGATPPCAASRADASAQHREPLGGLLFEGQRDLGKVPICVIQWLIVAPEQFLACVCVCVCVCVCLSLSLSLCLCWLSTASLCQHPCVMCSRGVQIAQRLAI